MIKKRSKIKAIWNYKCPRCHQGDLFEKPYIITNSFKMPKSCDVCNQAYEPEPGFYFGAMFISYIITGFLFLILAALSLLVFNLSVNQTTFLVLAVGAIFFIFFFRISRVLWIHFIVKYDEEIVKKLKIAELES